MSGVSQQPSRGSQRLVTADDGITPSSARSLPAENGGQSNDEDLHHHMFSFHKRRRQTDLSYAPKDSHYIAHKFYIRRPRALQYFYHGKLIEAGDSSHVDDLKSEPPSRKASRSVSRDSTASDESEAEARGTETVNKQRGKTLLSLREYLLITYCRQNVLNCSLTFYLLV